MNILLLKPIGYCVGVKRAIDIAKNAKIKYKNRNVVILGMLVHNNDALKELDLLGINTIYRNDKNYSDLIKKIDDDSIVILTAHGHSKIIEEKLKNRHLEYIDATCPFVEVSLNKIENYLKDNHDVIYIGKNNHPESDAALSLSNRVHLYELDKQFDFTKIKDDKPLIISQTTFSTYDVKEAINKIKNHFPNALDISGICKASKERQEAIINSNDNIDLIYVIGGKKSNNTHILFKLAQNKFNSSKVILIENEEDIKKSDLINVKKVALSSGTSTPEFVIQKIVNKINQLTND